MNFEVRRSYRLVTRGEAGLACDLQGVALGAVDLARLGLDGKGMGRCGVLPPGELGEVLKSACGPQPNETVQRIHRGLRRVAEWVDAGDIGRAGIETVNLGLPDLTAEAMIKLAEIADLQKRGDAWRDEPRVPVGRAGGGQWTTDGGDAAGGAAEGSDCADTYSYLPVYGGSPAHASTAAVVVRNPGSVRPITLPPGLAAATPASLLVYGVKVLQDLEVQNAQAQLNGAFARFGLDPTRPSEVMAAAAYVWAIHYVAPVSHAPNNGPGLDAAAEAVMRYVLFHPDALFGKKPDLKSFNMVIQAANAGVADYVYQSARPKGVDRKYQTTSASARAAVIAETDLNSNVAVHHLIPANVWRDKLYLVELANQAGWKVDDPSNLMELPRNQVQQARMGGYLPIHNASHDKYDRDAMRVISGQEIFAPKPITPEQAARILINTSFVQRARIYSEYYGEFMRVGA